MSRLETAIEALRLGDLDRAWSLADAGLKRAQDAGSGIFWQYAFVRAEVLRIRGRFEEAFEYLEARALPSV
jgi:hypothetical protein